MLTAVHNYVDTGLLVRLASYLCTGQTPVRRCTMRVWATDDELCSKLDLQRDVVRQSLCQQLQLKLLSCSHRSSVSRQRRSCRRVAPTPVGCGCCAMVQSDASLLIAVTSVYWPSTARRPGHSNQTNSLSVEQGGPSDSMSITA